MHAQEKERMCVREKVKSVTGWMEGRLRSVNHFFLCRWRSLCGESLVLSLR